MLVKAKVIKKHICMKCSLKQALDGALSKSEIVFMCTVHMIILMKNNILLR